MRVIKQAKETQWDFYRLIRLYLMDSWEKIQKELDRVKKPSKGRQKARDRPKKELDYYEDFAIVSLISKEHFMKK